MTKKAFEAPKRPSLAKKQEFEQEVLPPQGKGGGIGETAGAVGAFTGGQKLNLVTSIVDAVKDVSVAVTSVFAKHEETKQARETTKQVLGNAAAAMHEQTELTERTRAEQEGQTSRMEMQMLQELKKIEADLQQAVRELEVKQEKAQLGHLETMGRLERFDKILDNLQQAHALFSELVLDAYKRGETPPPGAEQMLRDRETALVSLSKELAALR